MTDSRAGPIQPATRKRNILPAVRLFIAAGRMAEPPRGVLSTEQLQARAARWYAAGADGVHLFNVGNMAAMKTLGSVKAAKRDGAKLNR